MKYVMVDAISSFRERYLVAVPDDFDDAKAEEWAMDSVTCEDVEEFSQLHIGEQISSTRVMTREEVLAQFDKDNDYASSWNDDMKLRNALVLDKDGNVVSGLSSLKQEKDNGTEEFVSTTGC